MPNTSFPCALLATRHVTEGEFRVARQRELVALLNLSNPRTYGAEKFLKLLENVLQEMTNHKESIKVNIKFRSTLV
jgi:hypothetical protein